jgi:hypothetical protein
MWYGSAERKGAILAQSKAITIIEAARPDLIKRARELREAGGVEGTPEAIARMFTNELKTNIGRELVRKWLKEEGLVPREDPVSETVEP